MGGVDGGLGIAVEQFNDLARFEKKLNLVGVKSIISTHVGVDESGWWAVVVYTKSHV